MMKMVRYKKRHKPKHDKKPEFLMKIPKNEIRLLA